MRNQLKEINTDAEMIVAQGMSLTKIQNTVEENSTAPSPGGGDVAATASSLATSEWNGCSSLGDVLIQRNVFIDIGTSLKKRKKSFLRSLCLNTTFTILAIIIVRIVFICWLLFYCLLFNHSFQINPNSIYKSDDRSNVVVIIV